MSAQDFGALVHARSPPGAFPRNKLDRPAHPRPRPATHAFAAPVSPRRSPKSPLSAHLLPGMSSHAENDEVVATWTSQFARIFSHFGRHSAPGVAVGTPNQVGCEPMSSLRSAAPPMDHASPACLTLACPAHRALGSDSWKSVQWSRIASTTEESVSSACDASPPATRRIPPRDSFSPGARSFWTDRQPLGGQDFLANLWHPELDAVT
jgi:hypothetical protein